MSNIAELVPATLNNQALPQPPEHFVTVGAVIQSDSGPSFQKVRVLMQPDSEVRPGEFLAVWHGRRNRGEMLTVVQVDDCIETNPNETAELAHTRRALDLGPAIAQEETSTRVFGVAVCKTIEDLSFLDGTGSVTTGAPELLCRAADPVVRLPDDMITAALRGLASPDKGLNLGSLMGTTAPMVLTPEILQLHSGIFGNPGKGKSYFGGVLIEEMVQWDIPVILLDVNGEMVDAVSALGGEVIALPDKQKFGLALYNVTPRELVSIIPNVVPGAQYAALIENAHAIARMKDGHLNQDLTLDELVEEVETQGRNTKMVQTSTTAAIYRVRNLARNKLIGTHFDFVQKLKEKRLICLDCRHLDINDLRLVAAAASRELQRYGKHCTQQVNQGKATPDEQRWLAGLFIDEAHYVVPEAEATVSTTVLRELARMGRHARTSLILASQSPADLDKSILKRLQTRFVFALERDQLNAIGGVRSDLGDELSDALPKLARGVCAVSGNGDQIRHGFVMKVRERRTPVGGGTPPVFANRVKRPLEVRP